MTEEESESERWRGTTLKGLFVLYGRVFDYAVFNRLSDDDNESCPMKGCVIQYEPFVLGCLPQCDPIACGQARFVFYATVQYVRLRIRMVIPAQAKSSSTRIENRLGGYDFFRNKYNN